MKFSELRFVTGSRQLKNKLMHLQFKAMGFYYLFKNWCMSFFGVTVKVQLYANPLMKWPVNNYCFCGSRNKFKTCCKNEIASKIDSKDLKFIKDRLKQKGINL